MANDSDMPASPCTSRIAAEQTLLVATPASSRPKAETGPGASPRPRRAPARPRRRQRAAPSGQPGTCHPRRSQSRRPARRRWRRPACRAWRGRHGAWPGKAAGQGEGAAGEQSQQRARQPEMDEDRPVGLLAGQHAGQSIGPGPTNGSNERAPIPTPAPTPQSTAVRA